MNLTAAQKSAIAAARAAGALIRRDLHAPKRATLATQHDIKLELDVRCQKTIERRLSKDFPQVALLGEEGVAGDADAEYRWVVDPLDGTVNFAYGIPHACVSIALQVRTAEFKVQGSKFKFHRRKRSPSSILHPPSSFRTIVGVVLDPFQDELWTAIRGQATRLNGRPVRVSRRARLAETVVSLGFTKNPEDIGPTLPYFGWLVRRVRKVRMMGAAALGLAYVATGRFDAYIERGVNLWDIAAGGLLVECAGGEFWHQAVDGGPRIRMLASNGLLRRQLRVGALLK